MAQTKEQCLEFLEKAREAVSELSVAEDGERQMERDEQQLVQSLEAEEADDRRGAGYVKEAPAGDRRQL